MKNSVMLNRGAKVLLGIILSIVFIAAASVPAWAVDVGPGINFADNDGEIGDNYQILINNNGKITNNYNNIQVNNGEVVNNYSQIYINNKDVQNNFSAISSNYGTVTNNFSTILTNYNNGKVVNNYGGTINGGTVENQFYQVTISDDNVATDPALTSANSKYWIKSDASVTISAAVGYAFTAAPTIAPAENGTLAAGSTAGTYILSDVTGAVTLTARTKSTTTITVEINGTEYVADNLEAAVYDTNISIYDIKTIEVTGGVVTERDWDFISANYFNNSSLESFIVANTVDDVANMPDYCLSELLALENVHIAKVEEISDGGFAFCENLKTVILPAVTKIGNNAFMVTNSDYSLSLPAVPPEVSQSAFGTISESQILNFVNADGTPLTGAALNNAVDSYKAAEDGDTDDNLWYGWKIPAKIPPSAPTITGPETLTLYVGYGDTSVPYTISGTPEPTVNLSDDCPAQFTWNAETNSLEIAAGLGEGTYIADISAANNENFETLLVTVTVKYGLSVTPEYYRSDAVIDELPENLESPVYTVTNTSDRTLYLQDMSELEEFSFVLGYYKSPDAVTPSEAPKNGVNDFMSFDLSENWYDPLEPGDTAAFKIIFSEKFTDPGHWGGTAPSVRSDGQPDLSDYNVFIFICSVALAAKDEDADKILSNELLASYYYGPLLEVSVEGKTQIYAGETTTLTAIPANKIDALESGGVEHDWEFIHLYTWTDLSSGEVICAKCTDASIEVSPDETTVYQVEVWEVEKSVYEYYVEEGMPSDFTLEWNVLRVATATVTVQVGSFGYDLNGDGGIDGRDAIKMANSIRLNLLYRRNPKFDVNGDGKVTIRDAVEYFNWYVENGYGELSQFDLNRSGAITSADVLLIMLRFYCWRGELLS